MRKPLNEEYLTRIDGKIYPKEQIKFLTRLIEEPDEVIKDFMESLLAKPGNNREHISPGLLAEVVVHIARGGAFGGRGSPTGQRSSGSGLHRLPGMEGGIHPGRDCHDHGHSRGVSRGSGPCQDGIECDENGHQSDRPENVHRGGGRDSRSRFMNNLPGTNRTGREFRHDTRFSVIIEHVPGNQR